MSVEIGGNERKGVKGNVELPVHVEEGRDLTKWEREKAERGRVEREAGGSENASGLGELGYCGEKVVDCKNCNVSMK